MGLKNARSVPALWQYRAMHPFGIRETALVTITRSPKCARARSKASSPAGNRCGRSWKTTAEDIVVVKNRYSALLPGASTLERVLRNLGADTLLIAGTKTNVCCESTASRGAVDAHPAIRRCGERGTTFGSKSSAWSAHVCKVQVS
jgi:isochorismatase family protein